LITVELRELLGRLGSSEQAIEMPLRAADSADRIALHISRELIHWESQSVTRENSQTGRRYQRHREMGSSIMLFARLTSTDRAFWFLGPACDVKHESERPMAVTWKLEHALPGDLFASFAAAVA